MPDTMQNEAMERLKQMYSKAQTTAPMQFANKQNHTPQNTEPDREVHSESYEEKPQPNTQKNLLEIFMQDKEKSLIVLLIVILLSEKADSTLILALMYLII